MKIFAPVLSILRPVRFVIVATVGALIFLSSALPAFAISSYQSSPTEGPTQLLETQRKTDEIAKSEPPKLKEVQEKSNKGLNEVQGDADIDKMKRPENSQSATSVEENVQNFLERVTGNK
ncbi:MAG: hypothetical protein KME59_21185 [Trichormus sp. ATA11-4-KO1]|jgi:hypothetical protein|nr:hypothetical protein [Trichormus sp. ATA11-4-KO1]